MYMMSYIWSQEITVGLSIGADPSFTPFVLVNLPRRCWTSHGKARVQAKKASSATSQMMEKAAAASSEGITVLSVVTEDAMLYTYHVHGLSGHQTPTFTTHDQRYLLLQNDEGLQAH